MIVTNNTKLLNYYVTPKSTLKIDDFPSFESLKFIMLNQKFKSRNVL